MDAAAPGRGVTPLAALVARTAHGDYVQAVGRGFVDRRTRRTYEGVTSVLKERFPRVSRTVYRRGLRKGRGEIKARDQRPSSPVLGTAFHAAVLHSMVCLPMQGGAGGGACVCPTGASAPACTPEVRSMVRAAMACFEEMELEPLCGELIMLSPLYALGARCDMIALNRHNADDIVLVSWKTSGTCPFPEGARVAEFAPVLLTTDTDGLGLSTQEYTAQAHLAQLACELHMLREGHHVPATRALIVYIYPGLEGRYRCIQLGPRSSGLETCRRVVQVLATAAHLPPAGAR